MINNVEELLNRTNEIEDEESRIKFIMRYFLENVQYNYSYLFTKGYAQGTISCVSRNLELTMNKTRADGDSELSLTQSIIAGESRIFNDILQIRDKNNGDYSKFIEELRNYIKEQLSSHLESENIINKNVEIIMKKIEEGLRKKEKIDYQGVEINVNYDISKVLIDFLLRPKKYFPPEFDKGLITKGVCGDYTECIVPILKKAGIEAHSVDGISEFGHSWIIVKVGDDYKSIDLTRAVFIRDGGKGISEKQTSEDWLYSNLGDIFKMQETRSITKIDGKELPYVIEGKNYDETTFIKLMEEKDIPDSTFKNLSNRGLKNGTTESDVINAERIEREDNTNEREDTTNE